MIVFPSTQLVNMSLVFRFLLLIILLMGVTVKAQHHHSQPQLAVQHPLSQIMDIMMERMDSVPINPSADQYFLAIMLPHHQGAVAMANYQIKHGHNTQMVQLAKSIRAEQQVEMQLMTIWLRDSTRFQPSDPDHVKQQNSAMLAMMNQLPAADQLNNPDRAFALLMAPHHQAAVTMAQIVIRYGTDPRVRQFAERLISAEQIEINQLHTFTIQTNDQPK